MVANASRSCVMMPRCNEWCQDAVKNTIFEIKNASHGLHLQNVIVLHGIAHTRQLRNTLLHPVSAVCLDIVAVNDNDAKAGLLLHEAGHSHVSFGS